MKRFKNHGINIAIVALAISITLFYVIVIFIFATMAATTNTTQPPPGGYRDVPREATVSATPTDTYEEDYLLCQYYWIRGLRNDMSEECLHHGTHWDMDPNYYGEEL